MYVVRMKNGFLIRFKR